MCGLLDQQAAQQHAAAGADARRRTNPTAPPAGRPGCWRRSGRRARGAASSGARRPIEVTKRQSGADAVQLGVLDRDRRPPGHRCRRPAPAASTAWPWRWRGCRCRSRHRRRSPSRPDRASPAVSRQPRVVACVPVPKAMPASISIGSSAGRHAISGCATDGPRRARPGRAGTSAGSRPPSPSRAALPRSSRRASAGRSPSPKISIRHGPSRESSRLVTTKPSSARCSSACSAARRFVGGDVPPGRPPLPWAVMPPR